MTVKNYPTRTLKQMIKRLKLTENMEFLPTEATFEKVKVLLRCSSGASDDVVFDRILYIPAVRKLWYIEKGSIETGMIFSEWEKLLIPVTLGTFKRFFNVSKEPDNLYTASVIHHSVTPKHFPKQENEVQDSLIKVGNLRIDIVRPLAERMVRYLELADSQKKELPSVKYDYAIRSDGNDVVFISDRGKPGAVEGLRIVSSGTLVQIFLNYPDEKHILSEYKEFTEAANNSKFSTYLDPFSLSGSSITADSRFNVCETINIFDVRFVCTPIHLKFNDGCTWTGHIPDFFETMEVIKDIRESFKQNHLHNPPSENA